MPTPAEQRALLFVAAVAVLGVGVRGVAAWGRAAPPVEDREALARQVAAVDSALTAGGRARRPSAAAAGRGQGRVPSGAATGGEAPSAAGPPGAGGGAPATPLDMDVATASDLIRLPGIGPTLAVRIVADRDSLGPFGSLEGLQRVRGIGPALARRLAPHVTFRLPPRLTPTEVSEPGGVRRP